ncbi:MAG: SH3 domain-containing protein [Mesorhizobium sp.]|nr:MAG: SH3 domain-containing protein [Mesorhizobium sp.]
MAGVFLRAGKALDTVMIDCGTLNKNGTVTDVIGDAHFHAGGSGGDPFGSAGQFCPKNALVTGMRVWKDHNNMVNSFTLRCTSMTDGTNTWTTMQAGGEAINDPVKILCKKDEIGTGIYGRSGSLIDNLGLLCADNPMLVAAESPAPPPAAPEKPIKHTGKGGSGGGGSLTPGGVLSCQGGGGMQVTFKDETGVFVAFNHASQPANAAQPGPGQCAWADRLFAPNEQHRLAFNPNKPNGQLLLQAVQGGTFQVTAVPMTAFIMVNAINNVQVVDGTPLSPGPANADDVGGDTPQTPADMGGMPPMQQADGTCGGGNAMATVVINQPGLDKLNVRSGPGGQVVGTVPEGGTVSVIGPCGAISGAAGFTKPKTQQGGGWCQIGAPVHGCVSSQFLAFGGGDIGQPGGAAGFVKSKAKHQVSAAATAGFGGSWSANADNVAYSLSLKQNGNGVSGRYRGDDGSAGQINGKVSGNMLRFSWVQKDGTRGSGKFTLSDDGQSFAGSYNFGNNPDAVEGSWNGTRQ